jgi:hypothetical protein
MDIIAGGQVGDGVAIVILLTMVIADGVEIVGDTTITGMATIMVIGMVIITAIGMVTMQDYTMEHSIHITLTAWIHTVITMGQEEELITTI